MNLSVNGEDFFVEFTEIPFLSTVAAIARNSRDDIVATAVSGSRDSAIKILRRKLRKFTER